MAVWILAVALSCAVLGGTSQRPFRGGVARETSRVEAGNRTAVQLSGPMVGSAGLVGTAPGHRGVPAAPASKISPEALELAKMCWLEAGFRNTDCAGMVRVIMIRAARAGVTPVQMAVAYSALGNPGERNRFARALPAGPEPTWTEATNARWAALIAVAGDVLRGDGPDPCPRADHFASLTLPEDRAQWAPKVESGDWRRVYCRARTVQGFFRVVR